MTPDQKLAVRCVTAFQWSNACLLMQIKQEAEKYGARFDFTMDEPPTGTALSPEEFVRSHMLPHEFPKGFTDQDARGLQAAELDSKQRGRAK